MSDDLVRLDRLRAQSGDSDNPDAATLRDIVRGVRRIAVVGASRDPTKAARRVPSYLAAKGFEVIPVNPHAERIWGRPVKRSLDEVHEPVDLVLVFRPTGEAAGVARQALARPERPVVWLQEGIFAPEVAAEARAAGVAFVQNLCIYKAHRSLGENAPGLRR
ncbi:MAG: CoA-binding protein [Gemmatimonadetes bacterium]|nr:MAG: CoA-binding protein [Gemmatimonadota bacterium]